MRREKDFLGEAELPEEALYGIHTWRARNNFPDRTSFHSEWLMAIGLVKQACYKAVLSFIRSAEERYGRSKLPGFLHEPEIFESLVEAARELSEGRYYDQFLVPALQGGAGTSINMNANEILANVALIKLGRRPGEYALVDPVVHANVYQSTNDVVPTALKLAVMQLLGLLEKGINGLRASIELLEGSSRGDLRLAYTQMQAAVPSSFGMLFGAYNEALSRDWWRVSRCFERIKVVNLGGGATGSGMAVPRFFIMDVIDQLQKLSGLPVTRSQNLTDTTQNLDAIVEVHAILKALAVNLEKMSSDIRLLSSDFSGKKTVTIPARQTGSSMMPGKVNPVILEYVIGLSHKVYSNDMLISGLCGQGLLDLNPYLPIIGHALLESIKMLEGAVNSLHYHVFNGLTVNAEVSGEEVLMSPTITTALLPYIGYSKATDVALYMKQYSCSVVQANAKLGYMSDEELLVVLQPDKLLQLGYSLKDV